MFFTIRYRAPFSLITNHNNFNISYSDIKLLILILFPKEENVQIYASDYRFSLCDETKSY